MKNLHKLELVIASWYKDMPHLPETGRKWIAANLWWLTLIGVILGAVGAFSVLSAIVTGAAIVTLSGGFDAAIGGAVLYGVFVTFVFAVANIILAAIAVSPLKAMRKTGWTLLFAAALVNVVSLLVSFVLRDNLFSLLWGIVFAALGGYFLFEIREFYVEQKHTSKHKTSPQPKP